MRGNEVWEYVGNGSPNSLEKALRRFIFVEHCELFSVGVSVLNEIVSESVQILLPVDPL